MPRISHDQKQFYKAKIRGLLARDHQMTQRAIQERLKEEGLDLDRTYLGSLMNAIYAERTKRADTMMLNYALAAFEDTMTEVVRVAWSIATDPSARKQDRVAALREIREAHKDVFEKLFDAGVFERKLGTLDAVVRNTPLAPERKKVIQDVFQNWGLIPPQLDGGTTPATNP
jgi:arginine repressor